MSTVVHVTHEAVHKVGGIGAVLDGLITAPAYAGAVERTLLVGPLADDGSDQPLGPDGTVLYDNWNGIWSDAVGPALQGVEVARGVRLVYGRRALTGPDGHEAHPEVLLVDVRRAPAGLDHFKYRLHQSLGLASELHEWHWDYEQYLRLAEPAHDAVAALLGADPEPCFVIAHEFMGLGAAFKALLEGDPRFVTIFYAHEVATARRLVEESPGRDVMFYNTLRQARDTGASLEDRFGDQGDFFKHALVSRAHHLDGIFAVGDWVHDELRFLGEGFAGRDIDLVYNGVPSQAFTPAEKRSAGDLLREYAQNLYGRRPDWIFTHVTRLVPSKGMWRDLLVMEALEELLQIRGETALLMVLATDTGRRDRVSIGTMATAYGWPLVHREGYPDLSVAELEFDVRVRAHNARARAGKVLFVNQFGWDAASCGPAMPAAMGFAELRRGTDVEFGQSTYEPFGIAQLEPLSFGGLCVVSDACGCLGFVDRVSPELGDLRPALGCLRADYTALAAPSAEPLDIDGAAAATAESACSARVAARIMDCLPRSDDEVGRLCEAGNQAAIRMSWECVAEDMFLPALERARVRTGR